MAKREKKEVTVYTLDPFVEWAHRTGRIFMIGFLLYAIAIPVICCIVFGAWPKPQAILPGLMTVLMMLGIQSVLEVGLYTPILGSSSYLTFATGNIMNLKIPCVMNAQKVAEVETNTTAGDAVALISTCVSSIVTIVVLAIGMLLIVPLRPFLESAVAQSASNYLLAALFGSIAVGFLAPQKGKHVMKNKLWVCLIPFILTTLLAVSGQLKSSMAMVMILVAIPLCIFTGRILYKKGVIYFADTTKKAPEAAQESAEK